MVTRTGVGREGELGAEKEHADGECGGCVEPRRSVVSEERTTVETETSMSLCRDGAGEVHVQRLQPESGRGS